MVCFFINLFDSYILLTLLKIDLSVIKKMKNIFFLYDIIRIETKKNNNHNNN